jgi:glutamate-ammonia-ligase adenylyltransferase
VAVVPKLTLPRDLEDLLREGGFRDPAAARRRLEELFVDTAEMLALARVAVNFRDALVSGPDPDAALLHLTRFVDVRGSRLQLYRTFLDHPALLDRFVQVVGASRYLADILVRNPEYMAILGDARLLSRPKPPEELREEFRNVAAVPEAGKDKLAALRRLHRREVLRIGAADLLGFQDLEQVTRQISELADGFAGECLGVVAGGERRTGLVVLALGKWGGRELNYSSDVDVIFLAPHPRDLPKATRIARELIHALSKPTFEGVVYRVDLRLRPYGAEGSLVLTAAAFEEYLREKARPAERQAMLKARAAVGDLAAGRRFLARIAPLLLRDSAGARSQVRRLKSRIEAQLHERGTAEGHVKLAPGGIRDVEFLVQALQLEAGRSDPRVLGSHTLEALGRLEESGRVAREDASALREAYVFLRAVEHRMQLMENQQVYRLPRKEEDLRRLARASGFRGPDSTDRLLDAYDARTRRVRAIFDRVLGSGRPSASSEAGRAGTDLPGLERLDPAVLRRCTELVGRIRRPEDVEVQAERNERQRWTLIIAGRESRGWLSLVCGLLAARRVNIQAGDFVRLPSRVALAVFEVMIPDGSPAEFWDSFREALAGLAGKGESAHDHVVDRVGEAMREFRGVEGPPVPVRVGVRNEPGAKSTELHIHATEMLGFLFELSAALEALGLDIGRALIRTLDDDVYDTFWVTDREGRKITKARALDELRASAALVQQFMHLLPRSPNPAQALRQFTGLLHQVVSRPDWLEGLRRLESRSVLETIADLMGVSRFLWEDFLLVQHENLFPVVCNVPSLDRRRTKTQLDRELARRLGSSRTPAEASAALNEFKDREMFRIDLRHITHRCGFPEFMASLSDLAEVVVSQAVERCRAELAEFQGAPAGCPWVVGALGKFGGRELDLASDLDLIFVYEGQGDEATSFHLELVKSLLRMIKARREGSFEIDLRLRPHGDSGALASSLDGFEAYYTEEGPARPFERLALVKLNPAAGDPSLRARLLEARDAFVYSGRPVDVGNLLHLRRRQGAELVVPGTIDAKYSDGGLVDVEYFVQARQIQAGHDDPGVRVPGTLDAIGRLARHGHLGGGLGEELSATWLFLRRLLEALRVVRGHAKDSKIPPSGGREFSALARRLEAPSTARLEAEIRERMSFARSLWSHVLSTGSPATEG